MGLYQCRYLQSLNFQRWESMDNHIGNFVMDEGFDPYGTHKQIIFDGDQVVTKRTYDAEPLLKEAHEARAATAGQRWGEGVGTRVGTIPMAIYADLLTKPPQERQQFLLDWLRANPAFVTFDKFLK